MAIFGTWVRVSCVFRQSGCQVLEKLWIRAHEPDRSRQAEGKPRKQSGSQQVRTAQRKGRQEPGKTATKPEVRDRRLSKGSKERLSEADRAETRRSVQRMLESLTWEMTKTVCQ